ncbi:MAG: phosphatidate cytidylyltransferase [Aliishimia sp.]
MSTPATGKWGDLGPRVASALGMVIVALWAIWVGGIVFSILVAIVCGLMVWELIRMLAPTQASAAWQMGGLGAVAVFCVSLVPLAFALPILVAPAIVAGQRIGAYRKTCIAYMCLVTVAGFGLIMVRSELSIGWILWLIALVVASDVMGYFAGKTFGGPKFWPAVSPKKTWSGTVAGWVGAACVGLFFGAGSGILMPVVLASIILAFAAQMGDIAESAIKRRTGVKDSSNLIPGHGGVLDRFDGVIGAAAVFLVLSLVASFPVGMLP